MKKLVYLLSLVLVATLFSCCEEENVEPDPVDEGIITLAELDGYWAFEYYEYEGEQYSDCYHTWDNSIKFFVSGYLNKDWDIDTQSMEVTTYWLCGDVISVYDFSKDCDNIKVNHLRFTVLSYNNGILKLRFDNNEINDDQDYLGGTLVLTKQ